MDEADLDRHDREMEASGFTAACEEIDRQRKSARRAAQQWTPAMVTAVMNHMPTLTAGAAQRICEIVLEQAPTTAAQPKDLRAAAQAALDAWEKAKYVTGTFEAMDNLRTALAATAAQPRKPAADDDWRVDAVEAELLGWLDDTNGNEREWAQAIVGRIDGWEAEGGATAAQPPSQSVLTEADRTEAERLARTFDARTELAHDIIDAATLLGRLATGGAHG